MTVRRNWAAAHEKVKREDGCRVNDDCCGRVEAAHVVARKHDAVAFLDPDGVLYVEPDDIVPLCTHHHRRYDAHELDLLPYLTLDEQARAALHVGLVRALARTTGERTSR